MRLRPEPGAASCTPPSVRRASMRACVVVHGVHGLCILRPAGTALGCVRAGVASMPCYSRCDCAHCCRSRCCPLLVLCFRLSVRWRAELQTVWQSAPFQDRARSIAARQLGVAPYVDEHCPKSGVLSTQKRNFLSEVLLFDFLPGAQISHGFGSPCITHGSNESVTPSSWQNSSLLSLAIFAHLLLLSNISAMSSSVSPGSRLATPAHTSGGGHDLAEAKNCFAAMTCSRSRPSRSATRSQLTPFTTQSLRISLAYAKA